MNIERRQSHNIGTHKEKIEKRKSLRLQRQSTTVYGTFREKIRLRNGDVVPLPVTAFVYVSKYNPKEEDKKHANS